MMNRLSISLFILLFCACSKDRCFNSVGDQITEVRDVGVFDQINIHDRLNLFIKEDSTYKVEVRGGGNLLPNVVTEVKDGWLMIYDENMCDWTRTYDHEIDIYVTLPELKAIYCSNTGNITALDTIHTRTFKFDQMSASGINQLLLNTDTAFIKLHTGTGDMTCFGETRKVYVYSSSYGYVDCQQFESRSAWVTTRNSGDVWIHATNRLEAFIQSEGNIHLFGGASNISLDNTGTGTLDTN